MAIRKKLYDYTSHYPHVIMNDLLRRKLDANRDLPEAAQGVPEMEAAWTEYHGHLYNAKAAVGRGLYLDVHCHKHPTQWVELGYLIPGPKLDTEQFGADDVSIRSLALRNKINMTFDELLRGSMSFGSFLHQFGYPVVPSPQHPSPEGRKYYSGGYNTHQHGSLREGEIDAIQIETPQGLLKNAFQRQEYADALTRTILKFLNEHYGMTFKIKVYSASQNNVTLLVI